MVKNLNDKNKLQEVWKLITQARKITLLTHRNPDADGISACAAMSEILEMHGIFTESIYPTPSEENLQRQPQNVSINSHSFIPDLVISFDSASLDRLYFPDVFKSIILINIDHHISNPYYGTYNFVDATAASTCEYLYTLLCAWSKSSINRSVAEALLIGMLYDSQVFHTQSTTASTLRIAADLIEEYGVSLFNLKNELLCNKEPHIILLWGDLLQRTTILQEQQTAWSFITQHDLQSRNLTLSSLIGFNNFLAQIADIDISLFFYEMPSGEIKASLRSKKTDVNRIAQHFNGGGHKYAAGFISSLSLHELVPHVLALIDKK